VLQVPDNSTHNSIMSPGWEVDKQFFGKAGSVPKNGSIFGVSAKTDELSRR
jgi:hypothetical protein